MEERATREDQKGGLLTSDDEGKEGDVRQGGNNFLCGSSAAA
jgi:hypothetical protein